MFNLNIFYFCFGTLFSLTILYKGIKILNRYFLDQPNQRSLHNTPIPRGGGLCFIIPVMFFDFFNVLFYGFSNRFPLSLLCIPLIIICLLDDLLKVPSIYRYIVQALSTLLILRFSPFEMFYTFSFNSVFILTMLIIVITGCINFTNFMDGSDGLVSGCMFILFWTLNLKLNHFTSLSVLLGSLFAFLLWNWPPAKVFMGDVGSNFLGIFFIANLLQLKTSEILGLLFIATPLYGDALITLLRRFLARQNIFKAHRQHLYQRLYLRGISKRSICIFYILQCSLISYTYLKLNFVYETITVFLCFFIIYLLDLKYALSFKDSLKNQ